MMLKSPGASLVAVVALGLGIGANTAIFSVANGILLHPLPFAHLDRVVSLLEVAPERAAGVTNNVSNADFLAWRSQARSFAAMGAWQGDQMNLGTRGAPVMAQGYKITPDFFSILNVKPLLGRDFLAAEGEAGRDREVMLSAGLWQRQFGSDPGIVGRTIELDEEPYTVVGVMPQEATAYPQAAKLWMPLAFPPAAAADRSDHNLELIAALKPGVGLAQAAAEMRAIVAREDAKFPLTNRGWGVDAQMLADRVVGDQTRAYTVLLLFVVGLVLLMACANVANLQFARALGRNHEFSIRAALGATRGRLLRQILSENIALGLAGAVVGLGLAQAGVAAIVAGMPPEVAVYIGGWDRIRLDAASLWFTLAIALGSAVLAGLFPAWQASRPDVHAALKQAGRSMTAGRGRQRLRGALVAGQVAVAMVVLVGAGLLAHGFRNLLALDQPSDPATVLTAQMNFPGNDYYTRDSNREAFYQQALARLRALPGVEGAALARSIPLAQNYRNTRFLIEGRPALDPSAEPLILQTVSPGFFPLLRVPVVSGRDFRDSDGPGTAGVAIISRAMAARYWPHQDAVGQRVEVGTDLAHPQWLTVVGVAADIRYDWIDRAPEAVLYRSSRQFPQGSSYVLLRGAGGDVEALAPELRQAIAAVNPQQPLFSIEPLSRVIHQSTIGLAYVAVLMGVAAMLALVLAAVGLFGLMSYVVGERSHEFGVRMSLGAGRGDVLRLVLGRGLGLLGLGLAVGLPLAAGLAYVLQGLLYGITAGAAATYAEAGAGLAALALVACYLPARQATRVDPAVALREG